MKVSPKLKPIVDKLRMVSKLTLFENFLCSIGNQKTKLGVFFVRLLSTHRNYTIEDIKIVIRDSIRYKLFLNDYDDWAIYFGINILEDRNNYYNLIDEQINIIDIGVNIGETVLNAAKYNTKGKIYGFELIPSTFERAIDNISLNPYKNINIYNKAISNTTGQLLVKISENLHHSGNNRITNISNSEYKEVHIEAITVDDFVKSNSISIDLIKIDVEGYEFQVLEGSNKTIEEQRPVLFIEITEKYLNEHGFSFKDILEYFEKVNYSLFLSVTNELIREDTILPKKNFDIIARPQIF